MNDLISRQIVLRCIKESRDNIDWGQSEDGDAFLHYTGALYRTIASEECLPSAERTGHWIECEDYDGDVYYECSECKEDFCLIDGNPADNLYNYCPNCGSHNPTIKRMEGGEE